MNASTGDLREIRQSTSEEIYTRGTQSCVKSKSYFPKKLMPLRPLNLAIIKKELEESWDEPLTDRSDELKESECSTEHTEKLEETEKESQQICDIVNNTCENDVSKSSAELPLSDKSNKEDQVQDNIDQQLMYQNSKHNSNLSVIVEEKENKLTRRYQKNDSFDLDFSALSLKTPVKANTTNYKTEQTKRPVEFFTPKVKNTVISQNSLSKKSYFKTPVNSVKKSYTPASARSKPASTQKISFKIPFDEVNSHNGDILDSRPSETSTSDIFRKIRVNDVQYLVLNSLGRGGSSEVFHGYNVENKCHVAIKCVSLQNSTSANSYINEVKSLQRLQSCEKIIKMYDYQILDSQKKLLVVLEKGGEDLSTILKRLAAQQSHLPMYMLLFYWMEMLYAVKQIHSHGIIHSDLKPANFLKADGGLKLIDFGIASSVQTDMTSVIKSVPEGSCNYISPEALSNDPAGNSENKGNDNGKYKLHYKSDVWSLGCILYQLVYRRTPFQHINQLWSKLAAIMNPDYKIEYPDANWVSPKIINTIKKCLQHNVRLRPSVDELVAEYENILNNI